MSQSNSALLALKSTAVKNDLTVDALTIEDDLQMRCSTDEELVTQYADNIVEILASSPIAVVEVLGADSAESVIYVVDGFHRYAAVQEAISGGADIRAIPVLKMCGTYDEAFLFAQSANWSNGQRPNRDDAAKSTARILAKAPDFGFVSKAVIAWLVSFGIPKSTARNHTKELRADIDTKRDAEIERLDSKGLSLREIGQEIGLTHGTVGNRLKALGELKLAVQNEQEAQNIQMNDRLEQLVKDKMAEGYYKEEGAARLAASLQVFAEALQKHGQDRYMEAFRRLPPEEKDSMRSAFKKFTEAFEKRNAAKQDHA
ncbi:MAG: hypothetical protein V7707_20140 [Motiliproteus sp.]